jgi:hypothetical protein
MGAKAPEVVEWRRKNWTAEQFEAAYGDLFKEENL